MSALEIPLSREAQVRLSETTYGDQATWWIQATPGVNYVRAELPARYLPGKVVAPNDGDLDEDDYGEVYLPRQEGAGIWLFPGNTTRALMMLQSKNTGHKVFVELDDNYRIKPPFHATNMWLVERDKTKQDRFSFEVLNHVISKIADGMIVSTPYLAELYSDLNDNIHVCRNGVDPTDWDPDPPHQQDGILRIGWAGSASHKFDLADIRLALDWASRQKDVEIVLMGFPDILGSLTTLANTRVVPWTSSLAAYRENLRLIDVMLCPNRAGAWADCKSDLKSLEAGMAGACSVVSKTEPFRPWWNGEAPGYNATTPKDFLHIVKHLVANRDEVAQTAAEAKKYVLEKRDIRETISEWRDAIDA